MMSLAAALPPVVLAAEPTAEELAAACGQDPGAVCTAVLTYTGSELLAGAAGAVVGPVLQVVLIVVVAYVANRVARKLVRRFAHGVAEQGIERLGTLRQKGPLGATGPLDLARARMRTETIAGVLRSVTTALIWAIAVFTSLGAFGINLGPLIAGAGIAGIALGFGAQNLVKDFLSGIFMLMEDQYSVGDAIDVGEADGIVEAISLRTTRMRDVEGVVWYVPNGEIRRIGNKSQQWSRALLDIGVAYGTDVAHVTAVIKRVADEVWQDPELGEVVLSEPEVWGVEAFGPNEIVIRLVVQTAPLKQWTVSRALRQRLKAAFDAEGIEIPFPQRAVWLRSAEGEPAGGVRSGFADAGRQ